MKLPLGALGAFVERPETPPTSIYELNPTLAMPRLTKLPPTPKIERSEGAPNDKFSRKAVLLARLRK